MAEKPNYGFELPNDLKWNTDRHKTPSPSLINHPPCVEFVVPERVHAPFTLSAAEEEALLGLVDIKLEKTSTVRSVVEHNKNVATKGKEKVEKKQTKPKDNVEDVVKQSLRIKIPCKNKMEEEISDKSKGKEVIMFERRNKDVSSKDKKVVRMEEKVEKKEGKQAEKVNDGVNETCVKTWNLRSRSNIGGNVKAGKAKIQSPGSDIWERLDVKIALTPREIEEDMFAMGAKSSRKIKKRPKQLQNKIDAICPGNNLTNISAETYYVSADATKKQS